MRRIVSVNLAVPEPNPAKGVGITGINKRPVDQLVTVRAPGPKTTGLHSGLVGDHYAMGKHSSGIVKPDQEVSLIELEAIEAACREYQLKFDHLTTRRNLLTEGVPLNHLVDRQFVAAERIQVQ